MRKKVLRLLGACGAVMWAGGAALLLVLVQPPPCAGPFYAYVATWPAWGLMPKDVAVWVAGASIDLLCRPAARPDGGE